MRTRIVIQSRLTSSRLPGKALMTVGGMPLIELVARRASRTGFEVIVATSEESYDERIVKQLERAGIPYLRGPLDDVLGRFLIATEDLDDEDTVVRLTGDNPVCDADLIQEVIEAVREQGRDYGLVDITRVPEGLGVEVFPVWLLRRAGREAKSSFDREHVTPWIRRHTSEVSYAPRANPGRPDVFRVTMDCLHDFMKVSKLFDQFEDPVAVPWTEIIALLAKNIQGMGVLSHEVTGRSQKMTSIILGVDNLAQQDEGLRGQAGREVFTRAVEVGVSDVLCSAGDEQLIASGLVPMLTQRMAVSVLIPSLLGNESPALYLRYLIERARADAQHKRLKAVLVDAADLASVHGEALMNVLDEYQLQGVIQQKGVLLHDEELSPRALGGITMAAARLRGPAFPQVLQSWHDTGRLTIGIAHGEGPEPVKAALSHSCVDVVAVQPKTLEEFTSLIAVG